MSEEPTKIPPQARDFEQAILGAMMLESDAVDTVAEILIPDDFYVIAHQKIYSAIKELINKNEPVDILTVKNKLKEQGDMESIGGAMYITELTTKINSAANIEYHARIVKQKALKRNLIHLSTEIQKKAYSDSEDSFELIDYLSASTGNILEGVSDSEIKHISHLFQSNIAHLEALSGRSSSITGITTGLTDLDKMTAGWNDTDLIVVAGRPGMGKTAFLIHASMTAAKENYPVGIVSMEMAGEQLSARYIANRSEIPNSFIRKGDIDESRLPEVVAETTSMYDLPVYVDDKPGQSIQAIRRKGQIMKKKHGIRILFVDFLQLSGSDNLKKQNREQEINDISQGLKNIGKELNIPVVALSQLNRSVEYRQDKRPQLSDLRESGAIEQAADTIIFQYRPEYYEIKEFGDGTPTENCCEFIIAKSRHGPLRNCIVHYDPATNKFKDYEEPHNRNINQASMDPGF